MNNKVVFELNGNSKNFTTVVKIVKTDSKNPFYPEFMGIRVDQNRTYHDEHEKQSHVFISYDNGQFMNDKEGFVDKHPFVLVHDNGNDTESANKFYFRKFSVENIKKMLNKTEFEKENININDIESFTITWKFSKFLSYGETHSLFPSIYELKIEFKNSEILLYLGEKADNLFYLFYNAYWNTVYSLV